MCRVAAAFVRFFALLCLCSPLRAGDGSPDDPLVFGVIPSRSPGEVLSNFGPLIEAMREQLGVAVLVRGAPDYEAFLRRVLDGETYDIILTGGDTVQFLRKRGLYQPLVQMDGPGIFALIATQEGSDFHVLDDLRGGARLATADPLAYSTGLAFRTLRAAGIDPAADLNILSVPSQSASLTALVRGQVDAAVIMVPVFRSAPEELRQSIRVLAETERAPPPAISVSTRMRFDLSNQIREFFVTLKDVDGGVVLLDNIGWPGFVPVRLESYDELDWAAEAIAERLGVAAD